MRTKKKKKPEKATKPKKKYKEREVVRLADMQRRLQARMNYNNPDYAFNVLLIGFSHYCRHSTGWVGDVRRKGSLAPYIARRFAQYVGYPIDRD